MGALTPADEPLLPSDFLELARERARQSYALMRFDRSKAPRVPWDDLHDVVDCLMPYHWWVLAAHTSQGKSTVLMSMVKHWVEEERPIYMLPLEQSAGVMGLYLAALRCELDPSLVVPSHYHALPADAFGRIKADLDWQASPRGAELVQFSNAATVGEHELVGEMIRAKSLGAQVFIIDHIHQLEYDGYEGFKRICKLLNELAKDFHIPIISSAQMARSEKRDRIATHLPPDLAGIQMGYVVGQTCHVALGAYRPFSKRLSRPDEAAIRTGANIGDFLEPDCVAVSVLKHRIHGKAMGQIVKLRYEAGQITDAPWVQKERWRMATVKEER